MIVLNFSFSVFLVKFIITFEVCSETIAELLFCEGYYALAKVLDTFVEFSHFEEKTEPSLCQFYHDSSIFKAIEEGVHVAKFEGGCEEVVIGKEGRL
jgi:hypothetical protein